MRDAPPPCNPLVECAFRVQLCLWSAGNASVGHVPKQVERLEHLQTVTVFRRHSSVVPYLGPLTRGGSEMARIFEDYVSPSLKLAIGDSVKAYFPALCL